MISISITTYNRSRLLKRCLESVRRQSFSDYEVLILDDCSSDDTSEVVKEFTKDTRFRYIKYEKNLGWGDKVVNEAQNKGYYNGDFVWLFSDDEYMYGEDSLRLVAEALNKHKDTDFVAIDYGFAYEDIEAFDYGYNDPLPETFLYDELSQKQKEILSTKHKVIYSKEFLDRERPFFNGNFNSKNDVCCEVDYERLFKVAKMAYVSGAVQIFGITENARTKYLDFYNWIVATGQTSALADTKKECHRLLKLHYSSSYPLCLNAFFSWGGDGLADTLAEFYGRDDFSSVVRKFAQIYKDAFQDTLYEYYSKFNNMLPTLKERQEAIQNAKNIVLYPHTHYTKDIKKYLEAKGKNILFVADDYKEGYKRFDDVIGSEADLVFISSGHPRIVWNMLNKFKDSKIKVVTLLLKDESYK
ncbi:glycosyltransferase family 2 protein [Helicobacter ibis]|uniref:Glycosyltransferase family 2 protein n=1 Tax=Helicobacter ibis TaxID=2962633 RepID=A0ABT4VDV0_9HELI|nr:glycosyltransferase family 2 protein [Helicobacter ibis]MDA3968320.1 glycosyltransferase family 2 protein [Helicobacter ibis]